MSLPKTVTLQKNSINILNSFAPPLNSIFIDLSSAFFVLRIYRLLYIIDIFFDFPPQNKFHGGKSLTTKCGMIDIEVMKMLLFILWEKGS